MKTNRYFLLFLILTFAFTNGFAQTDDEELLDSFDFEPVQLPQKKMAYFAIAGGYTGTFLLLNHDKLNSFLTAKDYKINDFTSPLYMSGVNFFTAIGKIPNLRIGFSFMNGASAKSTDLTIADIKYERNFEYSTSYTGISFDYGIVLFNSLAMLPGVNLGWNRVVLETTQTPNDYNWTDLNPTGNENVFYNKAAGNFWFAQPSLSFEYTLTQFIMFRLNAGYSYSFSPSWTFNKTANLKEVPDKINSNGAFLQFGLFIGLFNY